MKWQMVRFIKRIEAAMIGKDISLILYIVDLLNVIRFVKNMVLSNNIW